MIRSGLIEQVIAITKMSFKFNPFLKNLDYYENGTVQKHTDVTAATYTVSPTDSDIYVDATSGNKTVSLPAATGTGRILTIKKIDSSANTVTVAASGSETIDGANTQIISAQYVSITIQDAASGTWYII